MLVGVYGSFAPPTRNNVLPADAEAEAVNSTHSAGSHPTLQPAHKKTNTQNDVGEDV